MMTLLLKTVAFFAVVIPTRRAGAHIFMTIDALCMKGIRAFSGLMASRAIIFAGFIAGFFVTADALFMERILTVQHGVVIPARFMTIAA